MLPVSVTAFMIGFSDNAIDGRGADQERLEQPVGEPGITHHILDRDRAAGNARGMLQDGCVSSHDRRRRKPEHLPEREIPRHHCQDDTQGLKLDPASDRIGRHFFGFEESGRVLGIVVAPPGAFVRFGAALGQRLAHLAGNQPGVFFLPVPKDRPGPPHGLPTLVEAALTPTPVGRLGCSKHLVYPIRGVLFIRLDRFTAVWVQ